MVFQDVTPLSLGMAIKGDLMTVVIPKNTSIPVKKTQTYLTTEDNQDSAVIIVYEGERARASDNNLLGSFNLWLPAAPRGLPLEVCFDINENGILFVSASEKSTGNRTEIPITNDKERLSSQQIKEMTKEAEKYRLEDEKFLRKANVMNGLEHCIYKLKNTLKRKDRC